MTKAKTGKLYQDRKGGIYEVLMLTMDVETEETRVVYKEAHLKSTIHWDMPLGMFESGTFEELPETTAMKIKEIVGPRMNRAADYQLTKADVIILGFLAGVLLLSIFTAALTIISNGA